MTTTRAKSFDETLVDTAPELGEAANETLEDASVKSALEDESVDEAW